MNMYVDINKILLIGMPETLLNILFGLLIYKGRESLKEKSNIWKISLISIVFPLLAFSIKGYLNNSIQIQMIPALIILIIFIKVLWKTNVRCAFLMSAMATFITSIGEIATMQPVSGYIKNIIALHGFMHIKALIIWTIPTRIIQLITILVVYKFNLTFKNNKLLYGEWNELSSTQKMTTYSLFIHLLISITISTGYVEIFVKAMNRNMSIDFIKIPLIVMLFGSLYIIFSALNILFRQTLLEDIKGLFSQGASKLFENMLEASNEERLLDYKLQLDNKMKELSLNERRESNEKV
ncbi:hypothetical protein [Wukongibacter sp. M2B1]|uniref:hypothetical protein n=1 Tax=Wukongibacter sp. M2B1 TaxID=3088895 RepID=UPI003D7BE2FB